MQCVLGFYSCYFLRNEVTQMKNDGFAYLTSVWNYLDIVTPTTILSILLINTFQIDIPNDVERVL